MTRVRYLAAIALLLSLTAAHAEEEAELREGPCNKLREACKSFVKSSAKDKKSLYRDCMQPLLNDEKIEGVKIESSVIKACQAKKAELKQKK